MLRQTRAILGITLSRAMRSPGGALTLIVSIALVVATLLGFLAMSNGFARTLKGAGADDVAVIISRGAGAELNSSVNNATVDLIATLPGLVAISPEMFVIVGTSRRSDGADASLALRGMTPAASAIREGFQLIAGRMFEPGTNEIIVGRAAANAYTDLHVGDRPRFGSTAWKVVGEFTLPAMAMESEIWADLPTAQSMFNRSGGVQTVRVRLTSPEAITALQVKADADPRLSLDIASERGFYARDAGQLDMLVSFGWGLAIIMSLGAIAGALNMMHAAVDARGPQLATLRAIGFRGGSALLATIVETLLLAALGGLVGTGLALLAINGLSLSTTGSSYSQIAFKAAISGDQVIAGLLLSLALGLIGGFAPALRASRTSIRKLCA
jgi:putative ABC transport system permease protein